MDASYENKPMSRTMSDSEEKLQDNLAALHASASGVLDQPPPGFSLRGNIE